MRKPAVIDELSARQAKMLRFCVDTSQKPVQAQRLVVKTEWSDLPHTLMQALKAFSVLCKLGLTERVDKHQYNPTVAGREVVQYMNAEKLWQTPPPPAVTNKLRHRKAQ